MKKINLLFLVSALVLLLVCCVSTKDISQRDSYDGMCDGFKFVNKFKKVKNGEIVEVKWAKGASKMDRVANCEMFGEGNKKFYNELWTGDKKFGKSNVLTSKVKFQVPKGTKLPQMVSLRTWGASDKGPQCTTNTERFMIVP